MSYSKCLSCGGWIPGNDELSLSRCKCHSKQSGTQPTDSQHTNGGEGAQICPECRGEGCVDTPDPPATSRCPTCLGSGKLHHS